MDPHAPAATPDSGISRRARLIVVEYCHAPSAAPPPAERRRFGPKTGQSAGLDDAARRGIPIRYVIAHGRPHPRPVPAAWRGRLDAAAGVPRWHRSQRQRGERVPRGRWQPARTEPGTIAAAAHATWSAPDEKRAAEVQAACRGRPCDRRFETEPRPAICAATRMPGSVRACGHLRSRVRQRACPAGDGRCTSARAAPPPGSPGDSRPSMTGEVGLLGCRAGNGPTRTPHGGHGEGLPPPGRRFRRLTISPLEPQAPATPKTRLRRREDAVVGAHVFTAARSQC
jgi:hypothetical protein